MVCDYTIIDLLRHDDCEGRHVFRGVIGCSLSDLGWQQIISSPLIRCQRFVKDLTDRHDIPFTVDQRWQEINFGIWERQPQQKLWDDQPDTMRNYFTDPEGYTPEGGESVIDVLVRLYDAWQQLLADYAGQHLLVVQHNGTIRLLLTQLFGLPAAAMTKIEVSYTSLAQLRVYEHGDKCCPVLIVHNPDVLREGALMEEGQK